MGILAATGQGRSITDSWRALELFTDRRFWIRHFASYLYGTPKQKIIFFHGDGGNGKSLLLRYLQDRACKQLSQENWDWISGLGDDDFVSQLENAEGAQPVPNAYLDLGAPPRGEDRPQEAFPALLMLRRQLSAHGFKFPSFDYACLRYLHSSGGLTDQRLQILFPSDEIEPLKELAEIVSGISWPIQGVFNFFNKRFGANFKLYQAKRKLDEGELSSIHRLDPVKELPDELSALFARDLNAQMGNGPGRVVFLFDTHESFWRDQPSFSEDLFFERDEWLRRLLGELDLSSGIVAVIAGRDRPRWSEATKFVIPEEFLETHLIGHLPRSYAIAYLQAAGVDDAEMQEMLVKFAEVEPEEVHPLYLGLCSDIVLSAKAQGNPLSPRDFKQVPSLKDKTNVLMSRLLRYIDRELSYAVKALCACRAFDKEVFKYLGDKLNFRATEPSFQSLTQLSFVWRAERRGEGWYRVHNLLRRFERDQADALLVSADTALKTFYLERADEDTTALAEAIFHASQLDGQEGTMMWTEAMRSAVDDSRVEDARALLDVRTELPVLSPTQEARICREAASFFGRQGRFAEGIQECLRAADLYEGKLRSGSDDVEALVGLGITLRAAGELQSQDGRGTKRGQLSKGPWTN